ncbi:MAG: TIGR00159 family protein [Armatimonadetes bacterium]|nr:TIGR00159 family protein [Armatimonadota bacterium]
MIYRLLLLVRGTRAWQIFAGLVVFLALLALSSELKLVSLNWILERMTLLGPVALVILFLPELRHGLEGLGKFGLFGVQRIVAKEVPTYASTIDEIVRAVSQLARDRVGALVVIDRSLALDDIADTGQHLDAKVSAPLLQSLFHDGNPLHDGAAILRGDRVLSAGCRLPLSDSRTIDRRVHMRHRAAVGVTENSDCIAIAVSEERGTVSVAQNGFLKTLAAPIDLSEFLAAELIESPEERQRRFLRRRTERGEKTGA